MFWNNKKRTNIKAVDDQDFPAFLQRIGALGIIEDGKAKCRFCGNVVSVSDVDAVVPVDGDILFVCNRPKCMVIFAQSKNETID